MVWGSRRTSAATLFAVSYGAVVVFPHQQPDPQYLNVTAVPKSSATMSAMGASCGFLDNIVPGAVHERARNAAEWRACRVSRKRAVAGVVATMNQLRRVHDHRTITQVKVLRYLLAAVCDLSAGRNSPAANIPATLRMDSARRVGGMSGGHRS